MSSLVSETTRQQLAKSLTLLDSHKDQILEAIEASLRAAESADDSFGQAEVTAMILVELLLRQGRNLVERGALNLRPGTLDEHRALEIGGRHYSRFGDSLVAILRDTLGPRTPREITSAWCDAFWLIIRAVVDQRELVEA